MTIIESEFGTTQSGETVRRFVCENAHGCKLILSDYGAHVIGVEIPDRDGKASNVTLGFPALAGYEQRHPYLGSTVGRFCNRIAGGQFSLDGVTYHLATNNGPNHLHGGDVGFDRFVWHASPFAEAGPGVSGVRFDRLSPAGEEGYPGNLKVSVTYSINDENELAMAYEASTDATTVLNLTNHCYWNLAGAGSGKVLDHVVTIHAPTYLAVNENLIPTGKQQEVAGSAFDFRSPRSIGERISDTGGEVIGYDHCFVLSESSGQKVRTAARVEEATSGRSMEILTSQPGIQFYTGNFLDGSDGCGGFGQHEAFCLETQHFPDSPNQPEFPSTVLEPGQKFEQTTIHRFHW